MKRSRRLTAADAGLIAGLEQVVYPPQFWCGEDDFAEDLSEAGEQNFSIGLFEDSRLIAYIVAFIDESDESGDEVIYVSDLAVHPDHQRNGVARELITEFLSSVIAVNLPIEGHCRVGSYTLLTKHPEILEQQGFRLTESRHLPRYNGGEDHWLIRLIKFEAEYQRKKVTNMNAKFAEYYRLKSLARENGLVATGKMTDLIARLQEAGIDPNPPAEVIPQPEPALPTLEMLANMIAETEPKANEQVRQGRQRLSEISAAAEALKPVTAMQTALAALGLKMEMPDVSTAVSEQSAAAQQLVDDGSRQLGWAAGAKSAYMQLLAAAQQLAGLNVAIPDFLLNLRPLPHSFIFALTGAYKGEWTVEASTLAEAREMFVAKWQPNGWCEGGVAALFNGVAEVTPQNSVYSTEYRSTLTVRELLGITEQRPAQPAISRLFTFVLDSETDEGYEGSCVIRATSLEEAKRKLLASDIVSGTPYSEAEWSAAESVSFLEALVALSDTVAEVHKQGHVLKFSVR